MSPDSQSAATFRWKPLLVVGLLLVAIVGGVYAYYRAASNFVRNAYAAEWVGAMVVDYLRQHDDRWPASWDDLHPIYEQHVLQVGRPWSFAELQSRVDVDWNTNVDELRRAATENPRRRIVVVRLRDGSNDSFRDREPNGVIEAYLVEAAERATGRIPSP